MPTVVYGASLSPFVRKVRVVLAEKNIPYELENVFPGPAAPPEFKQLSPLGKIPALRDGERTLADSSVISAYLERAHPSPALYPADAYDYARALWFEEYADGGMIPVFGPKIFFQRIVAPRFFGRPTDEAVVEKAINEEMPTFFDYLERELGSRQFLVGDRLTIADIGTASPFVNLRHAGVTVDAARWPQLAAYIQRIHARPSFAPLIAEESAQLGN